MLHDVMPLLIQIFFSSNFMIKMPFLHIEFLVYFFFFESINNVTMTIELYPKHFQMKLILS